MCAVGDMICAGKVATGVQLDVTVRDAHHLHHHPQPVLKVLSAKTDETMTNCFTPMPVMVWAHTRPSDDHGRTLHPVGVPLPGLTMPSQSQCSNKKPQCYFVFHPTLTADMLSPLFVAPHLSQEVGTTRPGAGIALVSTWCCLVVCSPMEMQARQVRGMQQSAN